jgi:hypothetical protein
MRKASGFILALVFLMSSTELHQLFCFPTLVTHYKQHKQEDGPTSILSFMMLHYGGAHPFDNDESDDEKLPFKSTAGISHIDQGIFPSERDSINLIPLIKRIKYPGIFQNKLSSFILGVFHPPRLC